MRIKLVHRLLHWAALDSQRFRRPSIITCGCQENKSFLPRLLGWLGFKHLHGVRASIAGVPDGIRVSKFYRSGALYRAISVHFCLSGFWRRSCSTFVTKIQGTSRWTCRVLTLSPPPFFLDDGSETPSRLRSKMLGFGVNCAEHNKSGCCF